MANPKTETSSKIEAQLYQSREASYRMGVLTAEQKNQALEQFAVLIETHIDFLLAENRKDLEAQQPRVEAGKLTQSLYQRLVLNEAKLIQLIQGIRDVLRLEDPVGRTLSKTKLDENLVLEKQTVPLGVIGIIFESRPDVIPQILSLILKSGNAVVLKGGSEAIHSNHAFMSLVEKLNSRCLFLPPSWAQLFDTRQEIQEMLAYPQHVDLVIPRGSNELVQSIMAATKIPVLGHADGVCHLYVHPEANLEKAITVAVDAKAQYPAACNALETLLVDEAVATKFLPAFSQAANQAGILLRGCEKTRRILPHIEPALDEDWRTEYGDLTLAIKIVASLEAAIDHINRYGSHHTDGILSESRQAQEEFLRRVDSACVFVNASTRFADGFRFGLGAEIGISTAKTHARGPVGLEGLVIYKYILKGNGQAVATYVGERAKPFLHKRL